MLTNFRFLSKGPRWVSCLSEPKFKSHQVLHVRIDVRIMHEKEREAKETESGKKMNMVWPDCYDYIHNKKQHERLHLLGTYCNNELQCRLYIVANLRLTLRF